MTETIILPPKMVEGAIQHMNEDHAHNLRDYARGLAGLVWAEDVEMTGLDAEGFDLVVRGDGQIQQTRIVFDMPLTEPGQVRSALVALASEARQQCQEIDTVH
ncbi:MAG: DUF2470 domain-containing protein [Chloroflexota bacterium]